MANFDDRVAYAAKLEALGVSAQSVDDIYAAGGDSLLRLVCLCKEQKAAKLAAGIIEGEETDLTPAGPSDPMRDLVINTLINKFLPELMNQYGALLAEYFMKMIMTWLQTFLKK